MKAFIGEYGRIIIASLVILLLLGFAFGRDDMGFLTLLKEAKPEATTGTEDSSELLLDIASRTPPTLSVTVKKLQAGKTYNLLDKSMYKIKAANADGEELDVTIKSIKNPKQEDVTSVTDLKHFIPQKGKYKVTYYTEEVYQTATKATSKTYNFVAD